MIEDPIVEEIHAVRRKIAKECNYDMKEIVRRLRRLEEDHKDRLVSTKPREQA